MNCWEVSPVSKRRPPTWLDRFRPEGGSVWLFILSLLLSAMYWSYTVSELKSVKDLSVPLQYANIPQNLIVVGEDARRSVTVEFKGSPDMLKRVREEDVDARIDVSKLQTGPQVVELDRENVRLPSSVEFMRTYPKLIHFTLDRRLKDTLPLQPNFTGRTSPGTQVLSWTIEPPMVQVEGPESLVRKLHQLPTQPVPLDGRSTGFEIPVVTGHVDSDLAIPSPSPAMLRVVIGEKRQQRTISPISIGVVHGGKNVVTLEAPTLKVMVEGPESLVRNLAPEDFVAEVNVQGLKPSEKPYQIKPSLRLARSDLAGKVEITGWVDRFVGVRVEKGTAAPQQTSEPAAPSSGGGPLP